jgi:hypothetical protein
MEKKRYRVEGIAQGPDKDERVQVMGFVYAYSPRQARLLPLIGLEKRRGLPRKSFQWLRGVIVTPSFQEQSLPLFPETEGEK